MRCEVGPSGGGEELLQGVAQFPPALLGQPEIASADAGPLLSGSQVIQWFENVLSADGTCESNRRFHGNSLSKKQMAHEV